MQVGKLVEVLLKLDQKKVISLIDWENNNHLTFDLSEIQRLLEYGKNNDEYYVKVSTVLS